MSEKAKIVDIFGRAERGPRSSIGLWLLPVLLFTAGTLQPNGAYGQIHITDSSLSLNEDGETYVDRVSLERQPSSNVTVQVSSADTTVVTVSPTMLTFTPSNHSQKQEVTYTAVDDDVVNDPRRRTTITFTASGGGYDGASRAATVALSDNEAGTISWTKERRMFCPTSSPLRRIANPCGISRAATSA